MKLETFEEYFNKNISAPEYTINENFSSTVENDILALRRHFYRVKNAKHLNLVLKDLYSDIISILKRQEERIQELESKIK